jgi:hypothetical protein
MIAHDMRSSLQAMSLSAQGAIEGECNPEMVRLCLNRIEEDGMHPCGTRFQGS